MLPVCMWSRLSLLKQLDDSVPARYCLLLRHVYVPPVQSHTGLCSERSDATCAHRYRLLLLALLRQILDAVDEELVGTDVGPAGFYHPTAELHQLVGDTEIIIKSATKKHSIYRALT